MWRGGGLAGAGSGGGLGLGVARPPRALGGGQVGVGGGVGGAGKQKKRRVFRLAKVSCLHCRRSKQACDDFRPCTRCVRLGLNDSCVNAPSRRPKYPPTGSPSGSPPEDDMDVGAPADDGDERLAQDGTYAYGVAPRAMSAAGVTARVRVDEPLSGRPAVVRDRDAADAMERLRTLSTPLDAGVSGARRLGDPFHPGPSPPLGRSPFQTRHHQVPPPPLLPAAPPPSSQYAAAQPHVRYPSLSRPSASPPAGASLGLRPPSSGRVASPRGTTAAALPTAMPTPAPRAESMPALYAGRGGAFAYAPMAASPPAGAVSPHGAPGRASGGRSFPPPLVDVAVAALDAAQPGEAVSVATTAASWSDWWLQYGSTTPGIEGLSEVRRLNEMVRDMLRYSGVTPPGLTGGDIPAVPASPRSGGGPVGPVSPAAGATAPRSVATSASSLAGRSEVLSNLSIPVVIFSLRRSTWHQVLVVNEPAVKFFRAADAQSVASALAHPANVRKMIANGDVEPGPLGCIRIALTPSRVVLLYDATNATRSVLLHYSFLTDGDVPEGTPADAVAVIIHEVDIDGGSASATPAPSSIAAAAVAGSAAAGPSPSLTTVAPAGVHGRGGGSASGGASTTQSPMRRPGAGVSTGAGTAGAAAIATPAAPVAPVLSSTRYDPAGVRPSPPPPLPLLSGPPTPLSRLPPLTVPPAPATARTTNSPSSSVAVESSPGTDMLPPRDRPRRPRGGGGGGWPNSGVDASAAGAAPGWGASPVWPQQQQREAAAAAASDAGQPRASYPRFAAVAPPTRAYAPAAATEGDVRSPYGRAGASPAGWTPAPSSGATASPRGEPARPPVSTALAAAAAGRLPSALPPLRFLAHPLAPPQAQAAGGGSGGGGLPALGPGGRYGSPRTEGAPTPDTSAAPRSARLPRSPSAGSQRGSHSVRAESSSSHGSAR